jgi:hypothetical protein
MRTEGWFLAGVYQEAVALGTRGESTALRASGCQWDASSWHAQNPCAAKLFRFYARLPLKFL